MTPETLPETDFHKLSAAAMLLVSAGFLYLTKNAQEVGDDYLSLCGLKFPLMRTESLADMEARYRKRLRCEIERFQEDFLTVTEDVFISELEETLRVEKGVCFFLKEICPRYDLRAYEIMMKNHESDVKPKVKPEAGKAILESLLEKNCAVINGRIYPFQRTTQDVHGKFKGVSFQLTQAVALTDDVERQFRTAFIERLKEEAMAKLNKGRSEYVKTRELVRELSSLGVFKGLKKYDHCYEYGQIGYDFTAKVIYWLTAPHFNHTTRKRYKEGQSAVTLTLNGGILGIQADFAERNDRNEAFVPCGKNICVGGAYRMERKTIEDKIYYLKTFKEMVEAEKRVYEISEHYQSYM